MTSSCIFCKFCVGLRLFEGFQHLLFLYIVSKQKGDIIFTQNLAICLIKRIVVFPSFPLLSQIVIRFCLVQLASIKVPMFVCIFLHMLGFHSHPSPQHIFPLPLLPPNLKKYGNDIAFLVFLSLQRQTQITSSNLRNLYHQFSKRSTICINQMVLLVIPAVRERKIRDPRSSQVWGKVATCLHYRRGALCPQLF